jgi:hypothetical protein
LQYHPREITINPTPIKPYKKYTYIQQIPSKELTDRPDAEKASNTPKKQTIKEI